MIPDLREDGTWYIAKAKLNRELEVERHLNVLPGFQAWCPLQEVLRRAGGKSKPEPVLRPLYAPYVFVFVSYGQSVSTVVNTIGVAGMLTGRSREPEVCVLRAMRELRVLMARHGGVYRPAQHAPLLPQRGKRYAIIGGALNGFSGLCEDVGDERSKIWLAILGGRPVDIPNEFLEDLG